MQYTIQFYPDHALAVVTFTGDVTGDIVLDALRRMLDDPAWRPGYDRIWNGLGITHLDVDHAALEAHGRLAHERVERAGTGRSAIVARMPTHFLLSRLYEAVVPWQARAFETVPEALAWLGKTLAEEDLG